MRDYKKSGLWNIACRFCGHIHTTMIDEYERFLGDPHRQYGRCVGVQRRKCDKCQMMFMVEVREDGKNYE